jgi:hypothetical protein
MPLNTYNANLIMDALRRTGRRPSQSLYGEAGALIESRASSLGRETLNPLARAELERVVPILFQNSGNRPVTYQELLQFIHYHRSAIVQSAQRDDPNLDNFSSLLMAIAAIEEDAERAHVELEQQMIDQFLQRIAEA